MRPNLRYYRVAFTVDVVVRCCIDIDGLGAACDVLYRGAGSVLLDNDDRMVVFFLIEGCDHNNTVMQRALVAHEHTTYHVSTPICVSDAEGDGYVQQFHIAKAQIIDTTAQRILPVGQ